LNLKFVFNFFLRISLFERFDDRITFVVQTLINLFSSACYAAMAEWLRRLTRNQMGSPA
jgi:hypothetical protein